MITRTLVFSDIYLATLSVRVKYFIVTLPVHMCMWPETAANPYRHSIEIDQQFYNSITVIAVDLWDHTH